MRDELTTMIVEAQMEIEKAKHTMLFAEAKIEVAEKLLAKLDEKACDCATPCDEIPQANTFEQPYNL